MVRHQFFICFAPLGAIFVYQLLVAAGSITEPVTVAFATLGAGAGLNYILVRAINKVQALLTIPQVEEAPPRGDSDSQEQDQDRLPDEHDKAA